ncbi:MAG: glycosyltransferase [Bacteroidetes bacterium]|nr:glycosyltransferase [Bacteroidota bacterium]
MPERHLHIISFDIPYPPNYGGVIDIFYKIRSLHASGIRVHLHCFEYGRKHAAELDRICYEVHYYPRKTGLPTSLSLKPFIVISRKSKELRENLQKDNYPILFEGLHCCYYLDDIRLANRFRIYRESNIEHHYYYHLFKAERHIFRKLFFLAESYKLWLFQQQLRYSDFMLVVSKQDTEYLSRKFPENRVKYLPSFHANDHVQIIPGSGNFVLYQGNLSVAENIVAAEFLITEVFRELQIPLVIAGLNPPQRLYSLAAGNPNIRIIANPTDEEMFTLIRSAQINLMVTFQPTGLKLKLLNALFSGRHCLVNPAMVAGTELRPLCEIAENGNQFRDKVSQLMTLDFDVPMIQQREKILMLHHSNIKNCLSLLNILSLYIE